MAGTWDLADLATVTDLAAEYGVGKSAIGNWALRYPNFPAPLVTLARGGLNIYSRRQVRAWHDAREWTPGKHKGHPWRR
jgi:hypothetical protein